MKPAVCGVLTGVSYVSGIDYYRGINEGFAELLGKRHLMPPNPQMVLSSIDCDRYALLLTERRIDEVCDHIGAGVARLVSADVDFVVLASNTAHVAAPALARRFPQLPLLHIADTTARAVRARGLRRVGLLGTEPTMREDYLKARLRAHRLDVLVPDSEAAMARIFEHIMTELSANVFTEPTRAYFAEQVRALAARGCEGVILGCTEIELLELQPLVPDVPLFRSAQLHIEAATRVAAGLDCVEMYAPPALVPRVGGCRAGARAGAVVAAWLVASGLLAVRCGALQTLRNG